MELIDLGNNDAEVILRYSDMQWDSFAFGYPYNYAIYMNPDGHRLEPMYDVGRSFELDNLIGNTGVAGVLQFRIIDGLLQPDDWLGRTQTGTAADDQLTGGLFNDLLVGYDGNDTLIGGNGADLMLGGSGDDVLFGGNTSADNVDVIYAGDGNDRVDGGAGGDHLAGMAGNDSIDGSTGDDFIGGQDGNDVLNGGTGQDYISGAMGDDFVWGGLGSDTVSGGAGADRFFNSGFLGDAEHVLDYNAAEGDRLVFGGTEANVNDFRVAVGTSQDAQGNVTVDQLELHLFYGPGGQLERVLFTFANPADIHQLILRLPAIDSGHVLTYDIQDYILA